MEHAYFSPSASSRWLNCPASLFKTEEFQVAKGEEKISIYAHEGTVCHDIAAKCLVSKGKIKPEDYLGQIVDGVSMTPELVEGIRLYVDEIYGLAKEYRCIGGKIEEKVTISEHCWGTSDAILWNKDTILVCDLKMGKGVIVPAEDNTQLSLYAVGAAKLIGDLHDVSPKEIIQIIIQPRTVNPIRKYMMTRMDLSNWFRNIVVPIISKFKPGVNSFEACNPGETQCKWCPIAATCVEAANKAMTDAQEAMLPFTKANTIQNLDLKIAVGHKVNFKFIQQWMKVIDEFIMKSALAGEKVPGFKLVEGRSNRKWKADEKQVVKFLTDLNIEAYKKTLTTPPQAEKNMGKKAARENKLDKLITKPKGKPTLVPNSDTRPEMEFTVESEFEEFVDTTKGVAGGEAEVKVCVKDTVLVVGEDEVSEKLSALQRMRMAVMEEDIEPEEEKKIEEIEEETATGSNPTAEKTAIHVALPFNKTTLPRKGSKLRSLLDVADGTITIAQAAMKLGCRENEEINLQLQYLNERYGWGYNIYDDYTFDIYGAAI